MEVILGIIGIILAIIIVNMLMNIINRWFGSINWINFFFVFIFGGIALAVIFSFTSEGIIVIVGAFSVLMILALIFGKFKKDLS